MAEAAQDLYGDELDEARVAEFIRDFPACRLDKVMKHWQPFATVVYNASERTCRRNGVAFVLCLSRNERRRHGGVAQPRGRRDAQPLGPQGGAAGSRRRAAARGGRLLRGAGAGRRGPARVRAHRPDVGLLAARGHARSRHPGQADGQRLPIGAVVGRRTPMDRFGATAHHANTSAGTTVGIAASGAVLTILERDDIPQNAVAMGERLRSGLVTLVGRGRGVLALRQAGLFLGIDIGHDGMPAAGRRAMALAVVNAMRDDGMLVSTTGADEDALKVRPPLVCREDHVARSLEAFEAALMRSI